MGPRGGSAFQLQLLLSGPHHCCAASDQKEFIFDIESMPLNKYLAISTQLVICVKCCSVSVPTHIR